MRYKCKEVHPVIVINGQVLNEEETSTVFKAMLRYRTKAFTYFSRMGGKGLKTTERIIEEYLAGGDNELE